MASEVEQMLITGLAQKLSDTSRLSPQDISADSSEEIFWLT